MNITIWIDDIKIENFNRKALNKQNSNLAKLIVCEMGLFTGNFGD